MEQPKPNKPRTFVDRHTLLKKEALCAFIFLTVACLLSALWDAPLDGPADPAGVPQEAVKAPWIFLGIQQLLRYLPPFQAGIVLPLIALGFLAGIPYLRRIRGFPVRPLFYSLIAGGGALTVWGLFQ